MPDAKVDELLRTAIRQKWLVKLVYLGKPRIIEPHDYGVLNGTVKLLSYQLAGASRGRLPNWRWIEVDAISEIGLLDAPSAADVPVPQASTTNGTTCT